MSELTSKFFIVCEEKKVEKFHRNDETNEAAIWIIFDELIPLKRIFQYFELSLRRVGALMRAGARAVRLLNKSYTARIKFIVLLVNFWASDLY